MDGGPDAGRGRLWAEFAALYLAAPLVLAFGLPSSALLPGLSAVTALGLGLLHVTPGFRWSDLASGAGRIGWRFVGLFTAATFATCFAVVLVASPASLFFLVRERPGLLALIVLLYPALSALPQEIVFRALFFRRYGRLLPRGAVAQVVINATVFAAAHLMYWSWIVAAMTFTGGLAFAWSYRVRANFPEALVLHALAGTVLFVLGLGAFFYSGRIDRPF